MEKVELPTDIMAEIFKLRLNEVIELDKQGKVTTEEAIQIFTDAIMLFAKRYEDLAKTYEITASTCLDYGNKIIEFSKEIRRERRITRLFLTNHDLEWKYDSFESRILERIFESK